MKKLLLLSLLLTGCDEEPVMVTLHKVSIYNEPKEVCYQLSEPTSIKGKYCLRRVQ